MPDDLYHLYHLYHAVARSGSQRQEIPPNIEIALSLRPSHMYLRNWRR
jgi:hypothetical protein